MTRSMQWLSVSVTDYAQVRLDIGGLGLGAEIGRGFTLPCGGEFMLLAAELQALTPHLRSATTHSAWLSALLFKCAQVRRVYGGSLHR